MTLATDQQETQQETMFDVSGEDLISSEQALEHEERGSGSLDFPAAQEPGESTPAAQAAPAAQAEEPGTLEPAAAPEVVAPEAAPQQSAPESAAHALSAASEPLPILTAADFSALEERVLRAVSLVRREREARIAAEERAVVLEGRVAGLQLESTEIDRLKEEIEVLRAEREQVRLRVERLLGQLDSLEF